MNGWRAKLSVAALVALTLTVTAARAEAQERTSAKITAASKLERPGAGRLDPAAFPLSDRFVDRVGQAGPLLPELFPTPQAPPGGFAYSFVHVSDIQLRDPRNPLNPALHLLDGKVESAENNFFQDRTDVFYAAYLLKAIRAAANPGPALFVFHTGDSMHLSNESELGAFDELINDFLLQDQTSAGGLSGSWLAAVLNPKTTPPHWYFNLTGNHDLQFIGNARNEFSPHMYGKTGQSPRLNYNRLAGQLRDLTRGGAPLAPRIGGAFTGPERLEGLSEGAAYYSFVLPIPGHPAGKKVMIIALNTNETGGPFIPIGGLHGSISPAQRQWLQDRLAQADADDSIDHVLLFGHQPLKYIAEIPPGRNKPTRAEGFLADELAADPKLIAYFNGHDHAGRVVMHELDGKPRLLEYVGPAVMDSPKVFLYDTVRSAGPSRWEVIPRAFDLDDLARAGVVDVQPLAAKGLLEPRPDGNGFRVRWFDDPASGKRHLAILQKHLAGLTLTPPERSLYLAYVCLGGAEQDAYKVKARFEAGKTSLRDQHTYAEWRDANPSDKAQYERTILIDKTGLGGR
jgi:hypothetical protein